MTRTLAIARRELRAYFVSPIAYVVMAFMLLGISFFFSIRLADTSEATMRYTFDDTWFFLLLVAPIISMRLIAEEKRQGTIELLLTAPVRDLEVVLGKFVAALALVVCTLGCTLILVLLLLLYGNPKAHIAGINVAALDFGAILSSYVGELLIAGAFLSVGLFFSSLTQNQIVAAIVTLVALIMMVVVSSAGGVVTGRASDVIQYLSFTGHLASFTRGELASKDIIFFLTVTGLALFLAQQALGARRWQ